MLAKKSPLFMKKKSAFEIFMDFSWSHAGNWLFGGILVLDEAEFILPFAQVKK